MGLTCLLRQRVAERQGRTGAITKENNPVAGEPSELHSICQASFRFSSVLYAAPFEQLLCVIYML
jgi:hypothetical protein